MVSNYIILTTDPARLFDVLLLCKQELRIGNLAVTAMAGYQLAMIRLFRILYIVNDVLDCGADCAAFAGMKGHQTGGCDSCSPP